MAAQIGGERPDLQAITQLEKGARCHKLPRKVEWRRGYSTQQQTT